MAKFYPTSNPNATIMVDNNEIYIVDISKKKMCKLDNIYPKCIPTLNEKEVTIEFSCRAVQNEKVNEIANRLLSNVKTQN